MDIYNFAGQNCILFILLSSMLLFYFTELTRALIQSKIQIWIIDKLASDI